MESPVPETPPVTMIFFDGNLKNETPFQISPGSVVDDVSPKMQKSSSFNHLLQGKVTAVYPVELGRLPETHVR
jgi:hypothetical protein